MATAQVYVDVVIHQTVVVDVEYDVEDLSGSDQDQEDQIVDMITVEKIAEEANVNVDFITDWDVDTVEMDEYNTEEDDEEND